MQPTGKHDEISGFLAIELALEISRCNLPYFLGRDTLIKASAGDNAYAPDGKEMRSSTPSLSSGLVGVGSSQPETTRARKD